MDKVGVPYVSNTYSARGEGSIHECDVKKELMLGGGDITTPHNRTLDGGYPSPPVSVGKGFKGYGRKQYLRSA